MMAQLTLQSASGHTPWARRRAQDLVGHRCTTLATADGVHCQYYFHICGFPSKFVQFCSLVEILKTQCKKNLILKACRRLTGLQLVDKATARGSFNVELRRKSQDKTNVYCIDYFLSTGSRRNSSRAFQSARLTAVNSLGVPRRHLHFAYRAKPAQLWTSHGARAALCCARAAHIYLRERLCKSARFSGQCVC